MKQRNIFLLIIIIVFLGVLTFLRAQTRPNVLIINLPRLSKDRLIGFGKNNYLTPSLDALFSKSILFTNHYTVTYNPYRAHFALLTGEYPDHNNPYKDPALQQNRAVLDYKKYDHSLIAILKNKKYHIITGESQTPSDWINPFTIKNNEDQKDYLKKISALRHSLFFSYVSFKSDHENIQMTPYQYEQDLKHFDIMIGEILDTLKKENLFDSTLIVFTSETGNPLFEEYVDRFGKKVPLSLSRKYFSEAIIKTPLSLKLPASYELKNLDLNRHSMTNTTDLMPTILSILKIPYENTVEGINLYQVINKRAQTVGISKTKELGLEKYSTDGNMIYIDTETRGRGLIDVHKKTYYRDEELAPFNKVIEKLNTAFEDRIKKAKGLAN